MMAHPGLIEATDLERYFDAIRKGETLVKAAAAANFSLSALRNRIARDPKLQEREAEARNEGAIVKAAQVDTKIEELVYVENPNASIVLGWAKRYHPGYREKVEVVGAYQPQGPAKDDDWRLDMGKVMAGLVEAGFEVTVAPGKEQDVGPSGHVPRAEILPAPSD